MTARTFRWLPAEADKPATMLSVLVFGILEGEDAPDSHEGFHNGREWCSVRRHDEKPRTMRITHVTHYGYRPANP